MEWKSKIKNECCVYEIEQMIIDYIKAGFMSNDEILMECEEYIQDSYCQECADLTKDDLMEAIRAYQKKFQNTGSQENFLKLESVFKSLTERGIVALHYAGYTQSEGFEDCNETAACLEENGKEVIGCCFYSEQDLGHILHEDSTQLYLSFGNYNEKPDAEEIGQIVADALKAGGFCVQWNGSAEQKIAIENIKWDKYYTDSE